MDHEYISNILKDGVNWQVEQCLLWAQNQQFPTVFTTSLGKEDQVILHLIHQLNLHHTIEFAHADLKSYFKNNYFDDHEVSWEQLKPLYIKASAPEEKINPSEVT